jgi:ectoine hydroxylase-related dioxygenase (phytanoyl-CoA dioxygenase family)
MALSPEHVEHYEREGWIAPLDLLSSADAEELRSELEAAEAAHPEHFHAEHRNNAHLVLPFLTELGRHPMIVEAVQALVGADVTLAASVLFIKEPHSGSFVSWHQDAKYMALAPANFVTAWVALSPSTAESGCVAVVPGTHRAGARHHDDTYGEDNILTRGQNVPGIDPDTAVNLELQPGQMSLHHPWLVHGSRPNTTDGRRIGVAFQSYLGADVTPEHGTYHVLHVAGAPVRPEFVECSPPDGICTPAGVAARNAANDAYAEVLYQGASKRRAL